MGRIVVAVHQSESSRFALRWAAERALTRGATLDVVTAVPPLPPGDGSMFGLLNVMDSGEVMRLLEEQQDEFIEEALGNTSRPTMHKAVRFGRRAGVLRAAARNADLMVLGTKTLLGMRLARSWYLGRFPCPVITVGAQGIS